MTITITTAYKNAYRRNVIMVAQQKMSKLRRAVMVDPSAAGEKYFIELLGTIEPNLVTDRYGDSPLDSISHLRRLLTTSMYENGLIITRQDKLRTLDDPANSYVRAMARGFGRKMDDVIITAATGTAYSGKDGTTTADLASANKVALDYVETGSTADSGLTVPKVRRARAILEGFDVDPDMPWYFVAHPNQKSHLLSTTAATSQDFVQVKALIDGQLDYWMGFNWIWSTRLVQPTSTTRTCFACTQDAIVLGAPREPKADIDPARSDKKFNPYVYFSMDVGAVRTEEEKVVEVTCLETLG